MSEKYFKLLFPCSSYCFLFMTTCIKPYGLADLDIFLKGLRKYDVYIVSIILISNLMGKPITNLSGGLDCKWIKGILAQAE